MAVALTTGGPGALIWMWVIAFFGSIIQYSSCVLGAKYRTKNKRGEYVGGPMYYLQQGLGYKKIASIFAIFTVVAAIGVGNFAQVNSIVLPLQSIGINPLLCGVVIAVLAALVTLGGVERIAKVAASVVPIMALFYLGAGIVILCVYKAAVIPSLQLMVQCAFKGNACVGGVLGFGVVKALSIGLERGIFATDAGTGIVPILQSGAKSKNFVSNGITTLVAPFLVMVICTMTGLILLVTGAFGKEGLASTNMVVFAFCEVFGKVGGMSLVLIALFLFSYTTVIAWGGCAERAAEFLWDRKKAKVLQYFYLALIPVGAIARVEFVWLFADIAISFMLITNLIGIIGLSKEVILETRNHLEKEQRLADQ
jgi:AGCS family alanine or glycine:cation symporter